MVQGFSSQDQNLIRHHGHTFHNQQLQSNNNIMRWVQVTPGIILKSYTFSKLLDLSKSNGQKKILINANILIKISFIIPYLCHFILISKPKKIYMFLSLSSNTLPPPWPRQYHVFFCSKIVRSNILRVQPICPHTEFFLSHS